MSRIKASKISVMLLIIIVFSKLTGFVRDMLLADRFGSGMETDAYFIAITSSTILFAIIGIALNTIIIPIMSDIRENQGGAGELKYVNNLINIIFLFTALMTCLAYIFTPVLIKVLASGFQGEKFDLAVKLTRIGLPVMIFNGFLSVMKGYLHVHGEFRIPAYEGFALSVPVIFYLLFLADIYGIVGLMVVVTVSGLLRVLLYLPASFKNGFKFQPVLNFKDKNFQRTLLLIGPILLGILSNYINLIVDRTIASRLIESSISALSYAARVKSVVTELIVLTITAVVYTMIAKYISTKNEKELLKTINFGINIVVLAALPATVGLIILNYPLTMLLFQRGAFTEADTLMTASALSYYALGLVSLVVADLLSKVYFAKQSTKIPVIVSISAVGINIILNIILAKYMGHNGLALATSIAAVFSMTVLAIVLKKRIINIELRQNIIVFLKALTAGLVMGAIVLFLKTYVFDTIDGSLIVRGINLVIITCIGAISYGALLYAFKVEEMVTATKKILARLKTSFTKS